MNNLNKHVKAFFIAIMSFPVLYLLLNIIIALLPGNSTDYSLIEVEIVCLIATIIYCTELIIATINNKK